MKTDRQYREDMELPMEDLAYTMWGISDTQEPMEDSEIVEHAARKIRMLSDMLRATGMSPALLAACMKN